MGGVPSPGLDGGGYPGWGVPWPGGGVPWPGGYPGQGDTLARGGGTPACCAAVSMPLAFTQEDFLVSNVS